MSRYVGLRYYDFDCLTFPGVGTVVLLALSVPFFPSLSSLLTPSACAILNVDGPSRECLEVIVRILANQFITSGGHDGTEEEGI